MSAGTFETGSEQPGPDAQPGPYPQAGPYAQPGPYAAQPGPPPPPEGARAEYAQAEYPQSAYPPAGQFEPVSPQFRSDYAVRPRRTNSLAIAALSCGVGQLVAGPLSGVPAIVLGAISLRQIRQTGEDGRAMAMTGLVLGIVGTVLFVVGVALVIAFAVFAFRQVGSAGGTS
jgi:Domain of unknown function (DUF4190)